MSDSRTTSDTTRILRALQTGDPHAAGALLSCVYDELRALAARRLAHEQPGHTLQATALVHEAYLRLMDVGQVQHWNGRGHFFSAAAEAMRRILIERARRGQRVRHGGGRRRLDLARLDSAQLQLETIDGGRDEQLLALNDALTRLEAEEPTAAAIVKLRYFTGLTIQEAAAATGVLVRTANRHWAYAKAWLYQQLNERSDSDRE
jgi:RNA polymerase sigma factor (TIGR02999 family)